MGQIEKAQQSIQTAIEAVTEVDTGEPRALFQARRDLASALAGIEQFAMSQYGLEPDDLKSYRGVKR